MPADIILYAIVAAGLIMWLRNILGTRQGDETSRPNPYVAQPDNNPHEVSAMKSVAADAGLAGDVMAGFGADAPDFKAGLERHMAITGGTAAEDGLAAIVRADASFNLRHFMKGAQDAFVMIVEAFAAGDRETLQNLLTPDLYNTFAQALSAREQAGESASVEIHAVRHVELQAARLEKRMAYVTLRFVADETNVLRDRDGTVIYGNPDRVKETIDIWTFGRDIKSRSPVWLLMETRDEDAAAESTKTVPDSV